MTSKSINAGHEAVRAKGRRNWKRAIQANSENMTKEEAAHYIGLTIDGLNSLLYRKTKTTAWPIAKEHLQ